MPHTVRRILLVQLPVPPPGAETVEGNLPLAAAFLKLYARRQGMQRDFEIEIFPTSRANALGDQGLLQAVLEREPDLVGFTCYLWNIERSLWLAEQIKLARPEVKILLGGPEITADNRWAIENAAVDFAVFGEGEAAFAELLRAFREKGLGATAGLSSSAGKTAGQASSGTHSHVLIDPLDAVSSPYLEGILDAGADRTMLLETVRGCRFQCKYCYYSKRHAKLRYLSREQIEANLRHAVERGAKEIYLLDPTINQRADFAEFLRLLAVCNADRRLTFSGELRAEGIDAEAAKLLRAANFAELEIGLQSVEPRAHRLMGRPVDLAAWERGVRALTAEGIRPRLDLILGLPGDTVESVRRGIDFLARFRPQAEFQVFHLSILPGTDFRREAAALGLKYQARPPYHVLQTPTLDAGRMFSLIEEAQKALGIEFDAPGLPFEKLHAEEINEIIGSPSAGINPAARLHVACLHVIDLDAPGAGLPPTAECGLVTTLLLRSADFSRVETLAVRATAEVVRTNPHITLQVVLEPRGRPERLGIELLQKLMEVCYSSTSYLDRYYSMHPGHLPGAKRLFVLLPAKERLRLGRNWISEIGRCAAILWHGKNAIPERMEEFECLLDSDGAVAE
jgi:radical SAM superfamily enzyme YgiQ (UPF0313 family)